MGNNNAACFTTGITEWIEQNSVMTEGLEQAVNKCTAATSIANQIMVFCTDHKMGSMVRFPAGLLEKVASPAVVALKLQADLQAKLVDHFQSQGDVGLSELLGRVSHDIT